MNFSNNLFFYWFDLITDTSDTPEYVLAEVLPLIILHCKYFLNRLIFINWLTAYLVCYDIPFGIQDTQPHSITVIYLPARSNESNNLT